ncbi:biotin-dependent carboxyltransferase family protein [Nonomuraea sp. SMC257]|uniref:Biotin-dependent carboxyltransferase family protein n=1 Tax=Nonomuraea montanisoli TaxID=2741721 RepID=A0A7Y6I3X3_9ACTN|nr:biotin-dependent carboxyltransferase family protein [Nonomuraea montanisoli]NUW30683.1 biotin-dependent carboxyltransferase family protein [Nonomuraea montanisoli]
MSGALAPGASRVIEVLAPGPYATVQDLGRPGLAHLGVPGSGAADAAALRLANRLVGNPEGLAGIELTFGGARLAFHAGAWVAVTGAGCPLSAVPPAGDASGTAASGTAASGTAASGTAASGEGASGRDASGGARWRAPAAGVGVPFWVPAGTELRFGTPVWGLRSYLAVRGGVAVEPVLGSRSTDSLSGLGPEPLRAGTLLPMGPVTGLEPIVADVAPPRGPRPAVLRVLPGPRDDWFAPGALAELCAEPYTVSQDSNRVGVRLGGRELARAREGELPSEGMVAGALQVPPSGQPIVFLADHPPTGGYPVIAVLVTADLPVAAQLRPGDQVRFTTHRVG